MAGIDVMVNDSIQGFIRKAELSRERSEQRPDRFAAGEKIDAKVTQFDKTSRRLTLSVKALEVQEEKAAMQAYGSSNSGASLGDILGVALQEKQNGTTDEKPAAKKKAAPKKAVATEDDTAEADAEEKPANKKAAPKKAAPKKAAARKKSEDAEDEA